mgnify:CR=1 FL=1
MEKRATIITYGCQMNVNESAKMKQMLQTMGYSMTEDIENTDLVFLNTCTVREGAAVKVYGKLGDLKRIKEEKDGKMIIGVTGCLAQEVRDEFIKKTPYVDLVLGNQNIGRIPDLLERIESGEETHIVMVEDEDELPTRVDADFGDDIVASISITYGCNNYCTFCIVPSLRGKQRDRRPGEILAEVEALAAQGAVEVTLLGQNVNSYGVGFGDRKAFAKLLRAVGSVEGIERVRFTSPHPAAFTDDVIEAMATTPTVMPSLHMPLQSGSDRVLRAMRRSYRTERFMGILERVRNAIPEAAITTDIIVGFPGETEEDFQATLDVVEQARFASAFTFEYSPRPGTPAADREDQIPQEVMKERYARLDKLVRRITQEENEAQEGKVVEVLVAQGEGRKDLATERVSGRAADNRLVHVALPAGVHAGNYDAGAPRPGDMVRAQVTHGAPHNLIADSALDGGLFQVRRTRAGDAWLEAQKHSGTPEPDSAPVALGIPTIGRRPGL